MTSMINARTTNRARRTLFHCPGHRGRVELKCPADDEDGPAGVEDQEGVLGGPGQSEREAGQACGQYARFPEKLRKERAARSMTTADSMSEVTSEP